MKEMEMDKKWEKLSWQEKREERFQRWLSPDVTFSGPQAEQGYKERVLRFIKAIKLEEPDRVPVIPPVGFFPVTYAGRTLKEMMQDYEALKNVWLKFLEDFPEMDSFGGPGLIFPARPLEMIGHRLHQWPGHGLSDNSISYQYIEGEYMGADEYDKLIHDPTDFWLRTFMPREAKAFQALAKLQHLTPFVGIPIMYLSSFGDPEIQTALKTMMEAGEEVQKWLKVVGAVSRIALEAGYPGLSGGMAGAPFDFIADMCRGTAGIVKDMFRQPEKIHEAMESIIPIIVKTCIEQANASGVPLLMMPLHKGNCTFMSPEHFETFYWPSFKKLLMMLIEEGLVPMPFAEGDYEPRLDIIKDMPRSSMVWYFEQMDMAKAKEMLGNTACIAGNVPVSKLTIGTPEAVREHCHRLIETCAPGGGYILAAGASMDSGSPENFRAMLAAAREFGTYKSYEF